MTTIDSRKRTRNSSIDDFEFQKNKKILNESLKLLTIKDQEQKRNISANKNHLASQNFLKKNEINNTYKNNLELENIDSMDDSESYILSLKNGSKKYLRKVDYLIDDIIRKHRKKLHQISDMDIEEFSLPSIGPSPYSEIPIYQKNNALIPINEDTENSHDSSNPNEQSKKILKDQKMNSKKFINQTHSDWVIEELDSQNNDVDVNNNFDSDMEQEIDSKNASSRNKMNLEQDDYNDDEQVENLGIY